MKIVTCLHRVEHLASVVFLPPVPAEWIDEGYRLFAERFKPILDVFGEWGKIRLEVHPGDCLRPLLPAGDEALEATDYHPQFGFNFDPSHLICKEWIRLNSSDGSPIGSSTCT